MRSAGSFQMTPKHTISPSQIPPLRSDVLPTNRSHEALEKLGISIKRHPAVYHHTLSPILTHSSLSIFPSIFLFLFSFSLLFTLSFSFPIWSILARWTITLFIKLTHSAIGALTPRLRSYWLIATQDKEADLTNHLFRLVISTSIEFHKHSLISFHHPSSHSAWCIHPLPPSLSGNSSPGHH